MSPHHTLSAVLSAAVGALAWTFAAPNAAQADLEACGGVFLFGQVSCEFVPTETCMTSCRTEAMETSCAAELYPECEGQCTASASVECEAACQETCTPDCEAQQTATDEEPPNCMGLCMSDCQQTCNDSCADAERVGPCRAGCAHTCGDKCEERCKDEPEVAEECMPTCETSCTGSCTGQANVDCQVECQAPSFVTCETELVEKCKTECMQTGGAIFCDGQFLNDVDIEACAAELAAELDIEVALELQAEASGSVDIDTSGVAGEGGNDEDEIDLGDVKVDTGCAVTHAGGTNGTGASPLLAALAALGLCTVRRRRRARPRGREAA